MRAHVAEPPPAREDGNQPALPSAVYVPARRISLLWIIPLLALLLAGWLAWRAWSLRGLAVIVHLENGHGLKAGDDVRFRGIGVGRVESVQLTDDLHGVEVEARLLSQSDLLARAGTRFWVVRPQLRLTGVAGLETLIGPRYLAVLPATDGERLPPRQRRFMGLSEAPVVETIAPGDLEVVLQSPQRGSLHPGAPVLYRQSRIGSVLSVGLSSDGGAVESRLHIQRPYVQLVRQNSRFWDVGGVQAHLGITGLTIDIQSTEALLIGGVAMATPPTAGVGDVVRTGHRFALASRPEDEWLEWQPMAVIGNSMLPPGTLPPSPLRATIGWKQGRWITRERSRSGWVLQTAQGLLAPADLLRPGEKAEQDTAVLEVAGTIVPLDSPPIWERNGVAMRQGTVVDYAWPASRMRAAQEPEDCLVIADPTSTPLPLSIARLSLVTGGDGASWTVDGSVPLDSSWHGAVVVSRNDGRVIGTIIANDEAERARIALIAPAALDARQRD